MKKLLLVLLVISSHFSVAQTLKATLGQPTQLPLRLFNQKSDKCNIDVIYPDGGSVQYDVSKPEYLINIPFTPNAEGLASISWEGKFRMKGFASLFACEGNGKLSVYVVPTNEVKMQRWKELGSKVSESQKSCLSTALNKASIAFAWEGLDKEIPVDVNEPAVKEIRGLCEKYSDYVLKQNVSCKIGKLQSTCNEALQVITTGGKKQIASADVGEYISPGNKIEIVELELDEAKVKRQNVEPQNLGTLIGPSCIGVDYKSWSGCVGSMDVTDAPASWGKTVYTGEFTAGKFSGRGILTSKGWTYYGEFTNGTRDGYGSISYTAGSQYSGQWSQGSRHGIGKYVYENRQGILIGEFKDGNVNGKAVKYFSEGIVDDAKTGIYKNSSLIQRVRINPNEFPLFGAYKYPENNRTVSEKLQEKINFYLNEASISLDFKDTIFACDLFIAAESYAHLAGNYPGLEALSKKIDGICQIASLEKEKALKPFADTANRMCSEYQSAKNKCASALDYKKCMKILIPTYLSSEMWCE